MQHDPNIIGSDTGRIGNLFVTQVLQKKSDERFFERVEFVNRGVEVRDAIVRVFFHLLRFDRARQVSVLLLRKPSSVSALVEDDGHGFDPAGRHTGIGLQGMRSPWALRVRELIEHGRMGRVLSVALTVRPFGSRTLSAVLFSTT